MVLDAWLWERHPREEVARWAPTLAFFRYCRAYGGHTGVDADELVVAFRREGLERVLAALGLAVPGDGEQPGHVVVDGVRAHVWAGGRTVELVVLDPDALYDVTERSIAGARRLEPLLPPLADLVVDPPRPGEHCISPATWPELWPS